MHVIGSSETTVDLFISEKLKLIEMPDKSTFAGIATVGIFAGIGFTMSIFISLLAFDNNEDIINSKIAILIASTIAAITGFIFLKFKLKRD